MFLTLRQQQCINKLNPNIENKSNCKHNDKLSTKSSNLMIMFLMRCLHWSLTWSSMVYLQSIMLVSVSLSFASLKGASPHTSMYNITPENMLIGCLVELLLMRNKQHTTRYYQLS